MPQLQVHQGDITRLEVDAIVNAANERMLGGGGVDGAIHRAAGEQLLEACRAVPEVAPGVRCPTGQARITPGFELPARFVIHTVGPVWQGGVWQGGVWQGGDRDEPKLLASCYRSSLALAAEHDLRTVAFPAISCGVYQFPPEQAATIAVRTIRLHFEQESPVEAVTLVAFDKPSREILEAAVATDA